MKVPGSPRGRGRAVHEFRPSEKQGVGVTEKWKGTKREKGGGGKGGIYGRQESAEARECGTFPDGGR
jgi:hypothetical protein